MSRSAAGPPAPGGPVGTASVGEASADASSADPAPGDRGASTPTWRRWGPWLAMALVVVASLAVAVANEEGPVSNAERVYALARTIRCPECTGQSVAESDVTVSREIRRDIARRVEAGETDEQIRAYYASTYGEHVLLTPSASGATALVWILPVVGGVAAVAGVAFVFWRWRSVPVRRATDDDRSLVDAALASGSARVVDPAGGSADGGPTDADAVDGADAPEAGTDDGAEGERR